MLDAWSGALITASATVLVAVLTPVLGAFLPRLWQDDLRRLQAASETRLKRLEALEKALSVAAKAKAELGIDITTQHLQSELDRIAQEFADPAEFAAPAVLSREVLEEWENKSFPRRLFLLARLHFDFPKDKARNYRDARRMGIFSGIGFFLFGGISTLKYLIDYNLYYIVVPLLGTYFMIFIYVAI